jgi:Domain of unknown function (DUF4185)
MTELNDRIYFAFGDTFGYEGNRCRGVGGPNWRSNSFASTPDRDPEKGVRLGEWLCGPDGRAIAIVQGAHEPPFASETSEQTKIPTGMVAVDGVIYLHYMSVRGFAPRGGVWDCNYSKWAHSSDLGKTWHECAIPFGGQSSNFNMLAHTAAVVQLYGAFMTPSFLQDKGRTLFFVMSQYGPYNTFIMKAQLTYAP